MYRSLMHFRTPIVRPLTQRGRQSAGLACTLGCLVSMFLLYACSEDVGRCCSVLRPELESRIPVATSTDTPDVALDPSFDCENLLCVASPGNPAYCTKRCEDDTDCPDRFECSNVLSSDPGPSASIRQADKFCVREQFTCEE